MFSWIGNHRGACGRRYCAALLVAACTGMAGLPTLAATTAVARTSALLRTPDGDPTTDRIIVKWRERGVAVTQIDALQSRTRMLRESTGLPLHAVRSLGTHFDVLRVTRDYDPRESATPTEVHAAVAALRANPYVEFAEADERIYALAAPNDPRFVAGSDALGQWTGQWYLGDPSAATPSATGVTSAWSTTVGANQIVAVIDTGIRLDHP
jgi:serine protease